jgi:hypothetical protein
MVPVTGGVAGKMREANPESERQPGAVTTPTVEAQHFPTTLLCQLGMFVHASTTHLLEGRAHDFSKISLQGVC